MKEALRAMESSIMGIREYNEDMKFGADYCLFNESEEKEEWWDFGGDSCIVPFPYRIEACLGKILVGSSPLPNT